MKLHGATIDDTFSEAFRIFAARLIVTADDPHWARIAADSACGYATSIIGCDAEAGRERDLAPDETPDGRPGTSLLFFARSANRLVAAVQNRTGQCLMTCPTTAVFDGLPDAGERFDLGRWVAWFGDGHQRTAHHAGRPGRVIPVMEGEFFCERQGGLVEAVAGGTLLVGGPDRKTALAAARRAADAIAEQPGVITPFPGGICRCGSKVGSKYARLIASTNHEYCPSLRGSGACRLPEGVESVYEIVIDGLSESAVAEAMRIALESAAAAGASWIGSGNFGGRLGSIHLPLRELVPAEASLGDQSR
ncbi:MAG: formylmethanofuran--tetrahydromethanopterin N-formyltransferase [Phycisphaeraceae bacterium]